MTFSCVRHKLVPPTFGPWGEGGIVIAVLDGPGPHKHAYVGTMAKPW